MYRFSNRSCDRGICSVNMLYGKGGVMERNGFSHGFWLGVTVGVAISYLIFLAIAIIKIG